MGSIIGIDKEKLDQHQYLVSLMNEGIQKGILSKDLAKGIPYGLMDILKEVMRMYTKGRSVTLKAEKAEDLMKSMMYVIDLFLMEQSTPEDALHYMNSHGVEILYKEAMNYINDYIDHTKKLYHSIEVRRILIPNIVYHGTFTEAIPNSFLDYDVIFSAHHTSSDIDYPLACDDISLKGISYIRKYLEIFELENDFCARFDPKSIEKLLQAHGKLNKLNYEEAPINLFEITLNNIIFLTLLDSGYEDLLISSIEFELIEGKLHGLSHIEIKHLLFSTLDTMIHRLVITHQHVIDLIYRYGTVMVERLHQALIHGHLENIVVLEPKISAREKATIEPGHKMNNRAFRFVYQKIMDCAAVEDKILLLNKYVNSLEDFIDLLKADCFYGKEYDDVFNILGDLELSTLLIGGFKEHLLRGEDSLSTILLKPTSYPYDWQNALVEWIKKMDENSMQHIELLVHENLSNEIV